MKLWRIAAVLLCALAPFAAAAQSPVTQFGPFIPGHAVMAYPYGGGYGGQITDAGGPIQNGQPAANSVNPNTMPLGYAWVNSGLGSCGFSAYATGSFSQSCWGFDGNGNALWQFNGVNLMSAANGGAGLALLGTPTAPTPSTGDTSTKIATTAFVSTAIGGAGVASIPWEGTNTALKALASATSNRAMRGGVNATGDAPAIPFWNRAGNCVANGYANDTGHCVNANDGTSWISTQTILDASQFGIPGHGTPGATQAQAAIYAAYALSLPVYFPYSFDFTSLLIPPSMTILCAGPQQPIYRTAVGYGMATTDAPGNTYPHSGIGQGPFIVNCSLDGSGLVGSNLTIVQAERTVLVNVDSINTAANIGAEANISVSAGVATINSLNLGAIANGQAILCVACAAASNGYSTVTSQVDSTHWNVTVPGTVTAAEAVFAPTWTYTDSLGDHIIPSANVTFLGGEYNNLIYTRYYSGRVGGAFANPPAENVCNFSPIGILIDTTKSDGSEKMNQSQMQALEMPCNLLGLDLRNGADNWFIGMSFQNNAIAALVGDGEIGAGQNHFIQPYLEGGGGYTMYNGFVFTNGAQFNWIDGTGSMGGVTTALVDVGFGNRWNQTTRVAIHSGDPVEPLVDTYWPGVTVNNAGIFNGVTPQGSGESRLLDGGDGSNVAEAVMSYGTGKVSFFMAGHTNGAHQAQTAVQSGDVLGVFGTYGQYDTTNSHIANGPLIKGYATQNWANLSTAGAGWDFWVTPNGGSSGTAWKMDQDKSFHAGNLTAQGAGVINAAGYYVSNLAGVSCTVNTPAHLTVVNGLVTLCN